MRLCSVYGYSVAKRARKHASKEHLKKRKKDQEIFKRVRLQTWFKDGKERYWEVDESKERERERELEPEQERELELEQERELELEQERELEIEQERELEIEQERELEPELGQLGVTINSKGKDAIVQEIEQWEAEATERRLTMQANPAYTELDSWLQFTKWHAVLSKSKHDMLKTYEFLQYPGLEETELHQLLLAWDRIRERALDTLESVDYKDALKWWVSPKNEEQFICYMLCTAPAEFGDDTETGVVYTQEQWEAIRAIQETLEYDTTEHDTTEHDTTEQDTTEHNTTEHDTTEQTTDHNDTTLQSQLMRLSFKQELPTIELSKVVDSVAWTQQFWRSNYNFTKHGANQHLDVKYSYNLARARRATRDLQMLKQTENGELAWIDYRKHWYLTIERQFLRKLMVLVHIIAGQPSRGPELGSIKVYNSQYSARNIVVLNGRVAIITMYDKARRRRGNIEYILRYLPDDGLWAGEELSRELAKETTKHLGVRLTIMQWRHVAIGIAVEWLTKASKTWEQDEDGEEDDFAEGDDEEEFSANMINNIIQALLGLQRVLGPKATPKSEGQAAALELVYNPNRKSNIIILPTSAGKAALFFSLAAMSIHKLVIVVVPFTQLVADISTVQPKIKYKVMDSKNVALWRVAIEFVQKTALLEGKRGVIYVRTYKVGEQVSRDLGCAFYEARAYNKSEILQEWLSSLGGWIVATGALGTGINIHGIVEVIHIDRPYGLTSFAQQLGRGGRDGEISQSTIITRVASGASIRATALQSNYTVEKMDDDVMTDYIQSQGC
ncbi:hypothetical protein V493_04595 [Pseudogymnoascus sp. VKM F-4281 (FW-2241)]|nr:hypothetical protein V493_04595 [Pseudogymnoascus sp. VKM F-4281 (FW-2241)]